MATIEEIPYYDELLDNSSRNEIIDGYRFDFSLFSQTNLVIKDEPKSVSSNESDRRSEGSVNYNINHDQEISHTISTNSLEPQTGNEFYYQVSPISDENEGIPESSGINDVNINVSENGSSQDSSVYSDGTPAAQYSQLGNMYGSFFHHPHSHFQIPAKTQEDFQKDEPRDDLSNSSGEQSTNSSYQNEYNYSNYLIHKKPLKNFPNLLDSPEVQDSPPQINSQDHGSLTYMVSVGANSNSSKPQNSQIISNYPYLNNSEVKPVRTYNVIGAQSNVIIPHHPINHQTVGTRICGPRNILLPRFQLNPHPHHLQYLRPHEFHQNQQVPSPPFPYTVNKQQEVYRSANGMAFANTHNQQNYFYGGVNRFLNPTLPFSNFEPSKFQQMIVPLRQCPRFETEPSYLRVVPENLKVAGNSNQENDQPKRKKRTAYTAHTISRLEEFYKNKRFITTQEKFELCEELGLRPKQVKVWFQNRRMKDKKNSMKTGKSSS